MGRAASPIPIAWWKRFSRLTVPTILRSRGVELKFMVTDPAQRQGPKLDVTLITAIVRAHTWLDELLGGQTTSLREISIRENLPERHVRRILELTFLAPDITGTILGGRQPANLMLRDIIPHGTLPLDWTEQRKFLRMSQ